MLRSSSNPEKGSALIEAVVIGSFVFIVVVAAVSAAIDVAIRGGEVTEGARVAAVHSARHAGPETAVAMAAGSGSTVSASRRGEAIDVAVAALVEVPHPDGPRPLGLSGRATMPLAPYRSDRG